MWENLFAPWLESSCGKGNSWKELPLTGNWEAVLGFYMHQQLWLSTWISTAWNNYIRWDHVTGLPLLWAGRKQTSGKGKRHMMVLVTPLRWRLTKWCSITVWLACCVTYSREFYLPGLSFLAFCTCCSVFVRNSSCLCCLVGGPEQCSVLLIKDWTWFHQLEETKPALLLACSPKHRHASKGPFHILGLR